MSLCQPRKPYTSRSASGEQRRTRSSAESSSASCILSLAVGFAMPRRADRQDLDRRYPEPKLKQLFLNAPSVDPAKAGARPAILASLYIGVLLIAFTIPIGIGTAVYLEEYAQEGELVQPLPRAQHPEPRRRAVDRLRHPRSCVPRPRLGLGRVLLAGALILTLLVLPTVIVASREAIRAVPDSIRQGAFALGATKWQVVCRQVLPASIPGIATGSILACRAPSARLRRCFSSAPSTFVSFNPTLLGAFTALPIQIFQWIGRPQDEFKSLAAAAIIVLLVMLLRLNAIAIWLRNRYQQRW